jgi:hypothetical protein
MWDLCVSALPLVLTAPVAIVLFFCCWRGLVEPEDDDLLAMTASAVLFLALLAVAFWLRRSA